MAQYTTHITVLADNIATPPLLSEHGFAVLIERDQERILFDTGQGLALFENAEQLGIPLDNLTAIALSHGHYDHTGNLAQLLGLNPHCRLYLHPDCTVERYVLHDNQPVKMIGMPNSAKQAIAKHDPALIHLTSQACKLTAEISLTGTIPKFHLLENTSGPFYLDQAGLHIDQLLDDQSLWLTTKHGICVITGCCHTGLINTLAFIQQQEPNAPLTHLIGGLHLANATSERLDASVQYLHQQPWQHLYLSHCTGARATDAIGQLPSLINKVTSTYVGRVINV
ncbi:MBL fold metallo-hydrolase [Motilimonas cestriensis]|uniref:MBL fold metallo-hydrolase n=1 Tax=Motilimonas cestriensis TaxID=2742685 RepID=UPI003DA447A3